MGWTGTPTACKTLEDFIKEEFSSLDIRAMNISGSVAYIAFYNGKTSKVEALVVLFEKYVPGDKYIRYKDMHEGMGPYYYGASDEVLSALSPTTNKYIMEWREKCRQNNP